MLNALCSAFRATVKTMVQTLWQQLKVWMKPRPTAVAVGAVMDLTRSKSELILENAFLRHQLVVLERQVKRPRWTWQDRLLMLFIASRLPAWRQALLIIQPDTLLRWHRELF